MANRRFLSFLLLLLCASMVLTATVFKKPALAQQVTSETQINWLEYVNDYRAMAELPPVTENSTWNDGCWKHARYIVKNDILEQTEDPKNPWFTPEGLAAAQSSNIMDCTSVDYTDKDVIDGWMAAPFHAVGILDPSLLRVAYGSYSEADGGFQTGAALDVIRGLGGVPSSVVFPIKWPADGKTVSLLSFTGGEWPDPLASSPGYAAPTGLPIIIQLGSGDLIPRVISHSFMQGNTSLEHFVFDETNYTSPNSFEQRLGRGILNVRDAVVLIPKDPLESGTKYTVTITANDQTHTWSFSTLAAPPPPEDRDVIYVKSLYRSALGREPEQAGLDAWVNAIKSGGLSRGDVAYRLTNSHECHEVAVRDLYRTVLLREPDAGYMGWVNAMDAGIPRRQIKAGIYGSEEYSLRAPTDTDFINVLYTAILGRSPEPGAVATWVNALNAGLTRPEAAFRITFCEEYASNYITAEYQRILGRSPDSGGLYNWGSGMDNIITEEWLTAFLYGCDEYYCKL